MIPTFEEAGYDLNMPTNYIGVFVPRGVPAQVIDKLNEAILNATKDPEVRAKFTNMGARSGTITEKTWISWWTIFPNFSSRH